MPTTTQDVRTYYDRNSHLFLRFGSSRETQTIHRSLWPEGISHLKDALAVSNNLILEEARQLLVQDPRIADLGCGVGATLFHVLAGLGESARGIGLTLSAVQAQMAENARKRLRLHAASFIQADFHRIPLKTTFHLVYSIEAFNHAQEPGRYLQEVARVISPGGRLILLDDFRTTSKDFPPRWLSAYQDGWYVPVLQTVDQVATVARDLGLFLIAKRDLTSLLRLRSLPDALADVLLWIGEKLPQVHPIVPSMLGSMALQQCLKSGWIEYQWLVFEKK